MFIGKETPRKKNGVSLSRKIALSVAMVRTVSIPAAIELTPPTRVTRFQKKAANSAGARDAPIMV